MPCYPEKVLIEERGPYVPRRAVPASSGAPGERGGLAEADVPDSPAQRLGGKVNAYPLSFDSETWDRVERYREVVWYCPPGRVAWRHGASSPPEAL